MNKSITKNESRRRFFRFIGKFGTILFLLIMITFFSIMKPRAFATVRNLLNVLNQSSLLIIIACGLTAVVIIGDFDMSVAITASFSGVLVTGLMVKQNLPIWFAIICTIAICALCGMINGLIVTKLRVSSVIATIGTGGIIFGLNYAYTSGSPIVTGIPKGFLNMTLIRLFGKIPINIIYMAVIVLILWIILNRTELGQRIQAVGGNSVATKLSGINVDSIKITSYIFSSVCGGITGILLSSVIGSGNSTAADSYLMNSFAAIFLGSATLKDGEFHILGTLIGVIIINIGFNGLAIFGMSNYVQYIFQGAILVCAVALSSISRIYANK